MYQEAYFIHQNNTAHFSGLFDDILKGLGIGTQLLPAIGGLIGGGGSAGGAVSCGQGQAKGLAAIQQCSAQLLQALDALGSQIGQQPYQQIIDGATRLVGMLSDSTYFYQAQHGDDAAVLAAAKQSANQKLQAIIAAANAANANTGGLIVDNTGQVIGSTGNTVTSVLDILSSPLVIYGGLGLVAYLLIKKKK